MPASESSSVKVRSTAKKTSATPSAPSGIASSERKRSDRKRAPAIAEPRIGARLGRGDDEAAGTAVGEAGSVEIVSTESSGSSYRPTAASSPRRASALRRTAAE